MMGKLKDRNPNYYPRKVLGGSSIGVKDVGEVLSRYSTVGVVHA